MADENTQEQNTEQDTQEVQLTPVEQKAMEQGWRPLDQWDGDPEDWRDAKSFIDRGELFGKIDVQRREIKELRTALQDLKVHNSRIAEVEYKRALATLKAEKREALADGNVDAVMEIEEKIEAVKDAQREAATQPVTQPSEVNPMFQSWLTRNKWFEESRVMRAFANDLGKELASKGLSPAEVLDQVEKEVKKEFAEKFHNPNRNKPGAVESSTNKGGRSSEKEYELTDMERQVMQRLVKTIPGFSKEKYIADLKKIKGQ